MNKEEALAKSKIMYSLVPHPMTAAANQFSREKLQKPTLLDSKVVSTTSNLASINNPLLLRRNQKHGQHPLLNTKL